jgi:hypothetical protein
VWLKKTVLAPVFGEEPLIKPIFQAKYENASCFAFAATQDKSLVKDVSSFGGSAKGRKMLRLLKFIARSGAGPTKQPLASHSPSPTAAAGQVRVNNSG